MIEQVRTLQKLGLSEKEAQVYLGLLTLGRGSANAVARLTGLKRPTTYVVLEDLRKRGLALKMPGAKKQMFSARSPEDLVQEARRNVHDAERALPELMNTYDRGSTRVRTIHFEGLAGVREALWYQADKSKGKELVAFYGSAEDADGDLIQLFHEWNEYMAEQGTKIRSIAPNSKSLKAFREKDVLHGFLSKILPSKLYTSQVSIDVTDIFVRILMFREKQATIIENPKVAKALREIFEIVWEK